MHEFQVPPSTSMIIFFSSRISRGWARKNGMAMPGESSGLNHSLEIQACGRTVRPCSASSSCKVKQAVLEPGALDLHTKVLEADLQELLVGQRGPGEFSAHPCANLQHTDGAEWCHGGPVPTTADPALTGTCSKQIWAACTAAAHRQSVDHGIDLRHGQRIRVGLRHAGDQLIRPRQESLEQCRSIRPIVAKNQFDSRRIALQPANDN